MARQKTITYDAEVANEDLRGTFFYRDTDLWFRLEIATVQGRRDSAEVLVSDHVTIATTPCGQALITLRDACLDADGYTEV
jgi:hypothetical protein